MIVKRFQPFVAGEILYVLFMIVRLHGGSLTEQSQNITAYLTNSLWEFKDAAQVEQLAIIPDQITQTTVRDNTHLEASNRNRDRSLRSMIERRLELFHGSVVNHYDQKVLCWTGEANQYSGDQKFFYVDPGQESHPGIDVDHIQDSSGQWWKVGWTTVSVASDSAIMDAKCRTVGHNKPCAE